MTWLRLTTHVYQKVPYCRSPVYHVRENTYEITKRCTEIIQVLQLKVKPWPISNQIKVQLKQLTTKN